MKRFFLSIGTACIMLSASAASFSPTSVKGQMEDKVAKLRDRYMQIDQKMLNASASQIPGMQKIAQVSPDGILPDAASWGSLFTPDDEHWLYTVDYEYTDIFVEDEYMEGGGYSYSTIDKANFILYNSKFKEMGKFSIELDRANGETSINSVQIAPMLTKKFFNINDNYEVMVYVHATTENFQGHAYTKVYSLDTNGSQFICDIEGNPTSAINTAKDQWAENFTITFMHEDFGYDDDTYNLVYEVYKKAGWGTSCQLAHTFTIDYTLFSGAGDYALPLLATKHNNKLYYALPHYEKPFFLNWDNYLEEPVVNEDNNFIIELYDEAFNLIKTTSIPMTTNEGMIWTFPGMGLLTGDDDLSFGLFNDTDLPVYIVGTENYEKPNDDFTTDLMVYDWDGNKLMQICEGATDYIRMSDIDGFEKQFCFYLADEENGNGLFRMLNLPSNEIACDIPILIQADTYISTSIDRIAHGKTYKYVSSLNTADVDANDNIIHRIAWFNADGTLDHLQRINLGNDVAVAQVYVAPEALNPYLFNTDALYEFMVLVKVYDSPLSTKTSEYFRVYNEKGDILLQQGPENGNYLASIFLMNPSTEKAKLVIAYTDRVGYSIRHYSLPLSSYAGGDGTQSNPYQIASPGDLMAIVLNPNAHYEIVNDIDFAGAAWNGNKCTFSGSLNGNGYTISDMKLTGSGMFYSIVDNAKIYNLNIINSTYVGGEGGFIAGEAIGSGSVSPLVSNVHLYDCTAEVEGEFNGFGGIIGRMAVMSEISECTVKDCEFSSGNDSNIGGIVGKMLTGTKVQSSLFTGKLTGNVVGGIAGTTTKGDEVINNCHVDATIDGLISGGIIGSCSRNPITNCFVEGDINGSIAAGGIAGSIDSFYAGASEENMVIENCIVGATSVTSEKGLAHRIAGSTSLERKDIDWDHSDPANDHYVYMPVYPEAYIQNNYALSTLAVVDPAVADEATSIEGQTIEPSEAEATAITLGWAFGENASEPWAVSEGCLMLYFEGDLQKPAAVESLISSNKLLISGNIVKAQGQTIKAYNAAGVLVGEGYESLDASRLGAGLYIFTTGKQNLKARIK